MLSDPVQRERYDDARVRGLARRRRGRRRGHARRRRGAAVAPPARTARARPARPAPEPTVVLPEGMRLAEPRSRGLALADRLQHPSVRRRADGGAARRHGPSEAAPGYASIDSPSPLILERPCSPIRRRCRPVPGKVDTHRHDVEIRSTSSTSQKGNGRRPQRHGRRRALHREEDDDATPRPREGHAKATSKADDEAARQADHDAGRRSTDAAKDFQTFAAADVRRAARRLPADHSCPSTALTGQTLGMRLRTRARGARRRQPGRLGRRVRALRRPARRSRCCSRSSVRSSGSAGALVPPGQEPPGRPRQARPHARRRRLTPRRRGPATSPVPRAPFCTIPDCPHSEGSELP